MKQHNSAMIDDSVSKADLKKSYLKSILEYMGLAQKWCRVEDMAESIGIAQTSVSALIRNLRKAECGSYVIEKRRIRKGSGEVEYRLMVGKDGLPLINTDAPPVKINKAQAALQEIVPILTQVMLYLEEDSRDIPPHDHMCRYRVAVRLSRNMLTSALLLCKTNGGIK